MSILALSAGSDEAALPVGLILGLLLLMTIGIIAVIAHILHRKQGNNINDERNPLNA